MYLRDSPDSPTFAKQFTEDSPDSPIFAEPFTEYSPDSQTFAKPLTEYSPDSPTFAKGHFRKKRDSPRHIRTSNSPFWRIWGEWPLLRKFTNFKRNSTIVDGLLQFLKQTDNNNRSIDQNKQIIYILLYLKGHGNCQFDHINRMITLYGITLSGLHCI